MAYDKQTWQTGDVVTSAKLNHMEDGIANAGGGVLIVHDIDGTLDKTWQEIHDASPLVWLISDDEGIYNIADLYEFAGGYGVNFNARDYVASSANGYPALDES